MEIIQDQKKMWERISNIFMQINRLLCGFWIPKESIKVAFIFDKKLNILDKFLINFQKLYFIIVIFSINIKKNVVYN